MAYPTQPGLALSALSPTSLQGIVTGADVGSTNTLYYQQVGTIVVVTGPSVVGNGTLTVSNLAANQGFIAWIVSDNGTSKSLPTIGTVSLASADSVSGAMVAAFMLNPALVALCPYFFANEIPETTPAGAFIDPPMAVLEMPQEVPDFTFERDYIEASTCTIRIYAITQAQADQIGATFKAQYEWATLPFTTARNLSLMRTGGGIGSEAIEDRFGNRVFERFIEYQVSCVRTY